MMTLGKIDTLQALLESEIIAREAAETALKEVTKQLNSNEVYVKRMLAAMSVIPAAFALYDPSDCLVMANNAYLKLFDRIRDYMKPGISRREVLLRALDAGILCDDGLSRDAWLNVNLRGWAEGNFSETTLQIANGNWSRIVDRKTSAGDVVTYRVDVTNEKETEIIFRDAQFEAEADNQAKSAFLANMSHEIRTPMNGVICMAELLAETPLNEEQHLFATTIKNSGEALLVIINDILDYSKIEAGQMELFPEPFNFEEIAHEACMLLKATAQDKGLDMLLDFDMFMPTWFVGDMGRLRQVLLNLISNAIKFTQDGFVAVRVVGIELEGGNFELHVAVEDSGVGIPADKLDHVFGEFKQVDQAENRKFEGTGLGLAISRRLIKKMGGEMWVDSEVGKGSVFGFKVPLPIHERGIQELPVVPDDIKRIVIVDDIVENRVILSKQLGGLGITVYDFGSADEVLAFHADDNVIDMVITDHHMPLKNGQDLAREMRQNGYIGPIVMLSSNIGSTKLEPENKELFTAVLQKPSLRKDIYRALNFLFNNDPRVLVSTIQRDFVIRDDRPINILMAEDNKTNQLVFKQLVKKLNIDVRIVSNGKLAIEAFHAKRPDIMFTDISMPEMDGIEATQHIREMEQRDGTKRVPIIALTAHAMQGDKDRFIAAGMDDYLSKPLKKDKLHEMIENYYEFIDRA